MLDAARGRFAGEYGMSLVEVMVAILILGVVLSAFASTLTTTLTSVTRDEARVRGAQLASQVIEDLRATDWNDLGFYAGDSGYVASFDGLDTVTLGSSRPAGSAAPLPVVSHVVDRTTYVATTNVVWLPDAVAGTPQHSKQLHVRITWSQRGEDFQLTAEGVRPPTVDEVPLASASPSPSPSPSPGSFTITDFLVAPDSVTVTTSDATEQQISVTASTSLPAFPPTLTYNSVTVSLAEVAGSGGTQWTHTVPAGTSLPPGSYSFELTATGIAGGSDTRTVTVVSIRPQALAVTIAAPVPAPGSVLCVSNDNALLAATTFQWEIAGLSGSDQVTFSYTDQNGSSSPSYMGPTAAGDGSVWQATIPAGHKFNANKGATTVTIAAKRTIDQVTAAESLVYQVSKTCT